MTMLIKPITALSLSALMLMTGCNSNSNSNSSTSTDQTSSATTDTSYSVDRSKLEANGNTTVEEVSCTLSNGDSSTCYSVTINGFPSDRTALGPFCPTSTNITDTDQVGVWFEDGVLHDLTGDFVEKLSVFYSNGNWQLHSANGDINVTDTQVACEAAAQPMVAAAYQNHCVQCDIDYYNDGNSMSGISSTFLIPVTPVARSGTGAIGRDGVGLALNGVKLDGSAPTDLILSAYTIAALDDCVGHVNPIAGYHYHGANHGQGTCPSIDFESDGHGGIFGYALDGYAIHTMLDSSGAEESDLDDCRGHTDDERGYHYHTASAGENSFIGCFAGETAS